MHAISGDEHHVLRVTIQQRDTARMVLIPLIFIGWAATAVATAAVITVAVSTLVPLLILVSGFEAVFALAVNVARISHYLKVNQATEGWQAADFYHRAGRKGPDPLFSRLFVLATSVNFLPAALGWENLPELTILAALHLLFINRVRLGRAFAATENAEKAARANQGDTETRRSAGTEDDADANHGATGKTEIT